MPAEGQTIDTWLEVRRAHGANACPGVDGIFGAIRRLFPNLPVHRRIETTDAAASATVYIRPTSVGHEALIHVSRPREGERVILSRGDQCEGLADALAVALVMLIEPTRAEPTRAEPTRAEPATETTPTGPSHGLSAARSVPNNAAAAPPQSVATPTKTQNPQKPAEFGASERQRNADSESSFSVAQGRAHGRVSVVSAGGLGLMSTPSAGVGLGAAVSWPSGVGISLNGFRLWSLPAVHEPGKVALDLWAVFGGPCYRIRLSQALHLDSCWMLGIGSQRAKSHGYVHDDWARRSWQVCGPRLELDGRIHGWLGGVVSLTGFGHLKAQSFSIEGLGNGTTTVAEAPTFGLLLTVGLRGERWVF